MVMLGVIKELVTESLDLVHNNSMKMLNRDIIWDYSADLDQRIENSKVVDFAFTLFGYCQWHVDASLF